jgi:beta-glucosidase
VTAGFPADGCRDRGLTPVVTLNHVTTPRWFWRDGGWLQLAAGDRFARFVEAALPLVRDTAYVLPCPDQRLCDAFIALHHRAMEVLHAAGSPDLIADLVRADQARPRAAR